MLYFLLDSQENYKNLFSEKEKKLLLLNNTFNRTSNINLEFDIIDFETRFLIEKFISFLAFISNFLLYFENKQPESTTTTTTNSYFNFSLFYSFDFLNLFEELNNSTSFEFRIFLLLLSCLTVILILIAYFWRVFSANIKKHLNE